MSTDEKVSGSPGPYVFANAFQLTFGDNDVTIQFGIERKGPNVPPGAQIPQINVIMTPRSTKILAHILMATIQRFEKDIGPIPVAPGQLESLTQLVQSTPAQRAKPEGSPD